VSNQHNRADFNVRFTKFKTKRYIFLFFPFFILHVGLRKYVGVARHIFIQYCVKINCTFGLWARFG